VSGQRADIPSDIIIQCTPADLREIIRCLSGAEPIMVRPSGEFPAYVVDADRLDRVRNLASKMLDDFVRINETLGVAGEVES